jgi:flagellar biosynthesis protein FlhA
MELAIESGSALGNLDELGGHPTRDPVFGLEAAWVPAARREQAQSLGFMVFNPGTVITTHLDKIIVDHADELLSQSDVQHLLDRLAERSPKLLDGLVPEQISIGVLTRVLHNLLAEGIPLANFQAIVETVAEYSRHSQEPEALTAHVRSALGPFIVQEINGARPELQVVVLDQSLDQLLQTSLRASRDAARPVPEPETLARLEQSMGRAAELCASEAEPTVVLVADPLRPLVAGLTRRFEPRPKVLAMGELPDNVQIRSVGRVGGLDALAAG